jgi:hypothetical protein
MVRSTQVVSHPMRVVMSFLPLPEHARSLSPARRVSTRFFNRFP